MDSTHLNSGYYVSIIVSENVVSTTGGIWADLLFTKVLLSSFLLSETILLDS